SGSAGVERPEERSEIIEGAAPQPLPPGPLVPDRPLEGRKEPERHVGGLVVLHVRGADVPPEASESGGAGERDDVEILRQASRVDPGDQSRGRGFEVPLDAGDLSREEKIAPLAGLEGGKKDGRSVDVAVPVDHTEPDEGS